MAQVRPERSLLPTLQQSEEQLPKWTSASAVNSQLFSEDPAAALEAADLRLDREGMVELEAVLRSLAQKLELLVPDFPSHS